MTIASEIQRIKTNIANAYDALENKGATMPATEDSANLASTVNTVSTGGTIESLSITPSTSAQTITATGGVDGYSPINISAVTSSIDANIVAGNIKDGVSILGVTGTLTSGDEITATNTTGSAVSADDRVWVEPVTGEEENFTKVGTVTITDKVAKSLDLNNYITFPPIDFSNNTWEYQTAFKFTGDLRSKAITILEQRNSMYSYFNLDTVYLRLNFNGTSYDIDSSNYFRFQADTKYYIKISFDGSKYLLQRSTDGFSWITIITVNNSISTFSGNEVFELCHGSTGNSLINYLYLEDTYMKVNGNIVWTPYKESVVGYSIINDTDITSTSFTGIAQEAIANNATGSIKTLLDGNGSYAPTTATKSITTNGTYTASAENAYGLSEVTVNVPTPDVWHNWKSSFSWSQSSGMPSSSQWWSVSYGNGKFITCEGIYNTKTNTAAYSTDGSSWTSFTMPFQDCWSGVAYGDGNWVAVAGINPRNITSDKAVYSTDNGTTWTEATMPSSQAWRSLAYGNGTFVAVAFAFTANGGTNVAAYSTDGGATWSSATLPSSQQWTGVTYGNGKFVAIASGYNKVAYSTDGINWYEATISSLAYSWQAITYGNSKFVAIASQSQGCAYSTDGTSWTEASLPSSQQWQSVAAGDGKFIAVVWGSNVCAVSEDGSSWSASTISSSQNWAGITFGDNKFVAVASGTNISTMGSQSQCYTLTASPTTSTQVYEIPKKTSALTITAVGTGTITLSDSKVYNRNSAGDVESPVLGTKTITSNDTYTAASDYLDGFSSVTVDVPGITREVSAQGVYQIPASSFTFSLPSNATDIGNGGLNKAFEYCESLTSVDLSSLTTVSGSSGLYYAFRNCTALTSVDLSSLTTVSGSSGLSGAFMGATSLTSVDLSSLTTVSGNNGLSGAFWGATSLTSVDLSSLTTVSGNNGLSGAFYGCTGLTDIYFNALTTTSFGSYTNQFNNMMANTGTTKTHTLHFPSNLQSTISGLSGYPNFGGTSGYVTLSFDLPATS